MTKLCDGKSVGVILRDPEGRIAGLKRLTWPIGRAPIAGHLDGDDFVAAAVKESFEEVGVVVAPADLRLLAAGKRPNVCRRDMGHYGPGHHWRVYIADVPAQELVPEDGKTANVEWWTPERLQALADRTLALVRGEIPEEDFNADPGLEAVWVKPLAQGGFVSVPPRFLRRLDEMSAVAPPQ